MLAFQHRVGDGGKAADFLSFLVNASTSRTASSRTSNHLKHPDPAKMLGLRERSKSS
jgi:hypothetical protein